MSEFQLRKYDVDRIRSSLSGALDYRLDDRNELYLSAMFNQRDDYENRYCLTVRDFELPEGGVTPEGQIRRQTKGGSSDIRDARLEDQATASMTAGGEPPAPSRSTGRRPGPGPPRNGRMSATSSTASGM